jgi:hypothetical protein
MHLGKGKSDRKDARWLLRYGQQQPVTGFSSLRAGERPWPERTHFDTVGRCQRELPNQFRILAGLRR